jgi:hypothetical protein
MTRRTMLTVWIAVAVSFLLTGMGIAHAQEEDQEICGIRVGDGGCWSDEYHFRFFPDAKANLAPVFSYGFIPLVTAEDLGSEILTGACAASFMYDGDLPKYSVLVTAEHIRSGFTEEQAVDEYVRLQKEASGRADAAGREAFGDSRWQEAKDSTSENVEFRNIWGVRVRIDISNVSGTLIQSYSCARKGVLVVVTAAGSTDDQKLLDGIITNAMELQ